MSFSLKLILFLAILLISISYSYDFYIKYDNLPEFQSQAPKNWEKNKFNRISNLYKNKNINLIEINNICNLNALPIAKVTIHNSNIEVINCSSNFINHRLDIIVNKLKNLIKKGAKIKDVYFYLYYWDEADNFIQNAIGKSKNSPPIFTFAINKNSKHFDNFILFPDDFTISNEKIGAFSGWNTISKKVLQANKKVPFENKKNMLVWRGDVSEFYRIRSFLTPRKILLNYSLMHPDIVDAKIKKTGIPILKKIFLISYALYMEFSLNDYLSYEDQISYKVQIVLDGVTSTYPGLLWRLLSNSVTIKQESSNVQWFYEILLPWKHYVPVKNNLSNLNQRIEWILSNPKSAKQIADESTNLVMTNLTPNDIDNYIVNLLNHFADIQSTWKYN